MSGQLTLLPKLAASYHPRKRYPALVGIVGLLIAPPEVNVVVWFELGDVPPFLSKITLYVLAVATALSVWSASRGLNVTPLAIAVVRVEPDNGVPSTTMLVMVNPLAAVNETVLFVP